MIYDFDPNDPIDFGREWARMLIVKAVCERLGFDKAMTEKACVEGFDREMLIRGLWTMAERHGAIDFHANPVLVSNDPSSNDKVVFERKQYGTSVVIEAEGLIVHRLCS